ncbi:MAG TPA: peptidylprolyl isomerase [Opitutaceae bacterium]|nr:peptidylprolyl isomerase [Opitutaceae bacterium]
MTPARVLSLIVAASLAGASFAQTPPGPANQALAEKARQRVEERARLIAEFRREGSRHIPTEYIDTAIADEIAERFSGDRSKFLEHLRTEGKTIKEYRAAVEENIIYQYMRNQERRAGEADREAEHPVAPAVNETTEPRVHLRLIQLTRSADETDVALRARADHVVARFKSGEKFAGLALEYSQDLKRAKGGDWGWLKRSDFKREFADIAFGLNPGEVSPPILLPEGAFLLYVEGRK